MIIKYKEKRIKMSKKKKVVRALVIALFILGILLSLFLVLIDPIKSFFRQKVIDDSLVSIESQIANGDTEITFPVPDTDALSIIGEDEEEEGDLEDLLADMAAYSNKHQNLVCLGILQVPDLEIKEPIWDSCSRVALRYGVGRYPLSCNFGEPGNATILGHRNRHISTIFYRLQSIKKGTLVLITLTDGSVKQYKVVRTKNVAPSNLDKYLNANASKTEQLTLVTCATELGKGYRFCAICEPIVEENTETTVMED